MLYYLFDWLEKTYQLLGASVFQFISFRAGLAMILSLIITITFGKKIINFIRKKQIGETVRDLGLEGQTQKTGTPTMGGLMIIAAIAIPTLLLAKIENIYIILLIVSTLWMGLIGFLDDYIKVFRKNKKGLAGKFKVVGQVGLGLIVGIVLYFDDDVVVRNYQLSNTEAVVEIGEIPYEDVKSTKTTIPFVKSNDIQYHDLLPFIPKELEYLIFIPLVIFIVTAVSNGANITDGIDGLAAGTSAVIGMVLAVFAYLSGNVIFSDYLNIMHIPGSGEIVVFCAAFVGACIGFLWYNAFPAQIFMGDTGSLSIGGAIAVTSLAVRKELLLPILCGIFLIENLSVIIQVFYFKYTRKKYGEGRRIFKMAPLHHHYQMMNIHESKIVSRFGVVAILLALITLSTLKLR